MRVLLPIAAAILCFAGTPAGAQQMNGTDAHARVSAARFATCLVRHGARSWRAVLKEPVGGEGWMARFQRNLDSVCLRDYRAENVQGVTVMSLSFTPLLLRGNMFDALYRIDFGAKPAVASFDAIPALVYPVADGAEETVAQPYLVNMALGDCVARKAPGEARAFLLTEVASAAETAALQALAPAFAACVPAGAELALTRSKARAALAEPLYRLTQGQVNP